MSLDFIPVNRDPKSCQFSPAYMLRIYTVQTAIIWHCSFSAISLILMSVIFYQPDPASV